MRKIASLLRKIASLLYKCKHLSVTSLLIQSIKTAEIDATSLLVRSDTRLRRVSVLAILSSCIYRPVSLTERKVAGLVVAAARSQRYALLLFASVHRETSDDDGNS